MNSAKLINALLIALIAVNGLFLIGWAVSSAHHRQNQRFAMQSRFYARRHSEFAFRYHHSESFHGCAGDNRNHGDSRWN